MNKLQDKIKYIKRILRTPYHFFFITSSKQISILFENKQGNRYSFTGLSMYNAVETAEEYVKTEIKMGSLFEPTKNKKVKNENQ